jgi:arylsulfatase A-like enzyme
VLALAVLSAVLSCASNTADQGATRQQPNILFILVDDLGFNDLGVYGGENVPSPNLDRFAREGVRFTRNYVDSTCAASRAGMLTGTPPASRGFRPAGLGISPEFTTLPEALAQAGYTTHHVGKWHLGHASRLAWPTAQGFDDFFGFLNHNYLRGLQQTGAWHRPDYQDPWLQERDDSPRQYKGHLSDLLLGRVLSFLKSPDLNGQPWFLNYWMFAPHRPIQPAPRFSRRHPDSPEGRYLALLEQMDDGIGQVLQTLEASGQADNTLVLIASDNGGTNRYRDSNAPFRGEKWTYLEGGVRTPLLIRWPDNFAGGSVFSRPVSYLDYMPTLLAAAGAAVPGGLQGRDLRQVIAADEAMNHALFWDSGNSTTHAWAALSADGNWRLSKFFIGDRVLNDLAGDPAGAVDVSARHPQIVADMQAEFINWRHRQRRVMVNYQLLDDGGRALLSGESLQRAPGYGGRSFAIAVEPNVEAQNGSSQVIALQPRYWQLGQAGSRLQLEILGVTLEAKALPPGVCSSVIVTSRYERERMSGAKPEGIIELFVNGERVASKHVQNPAVPEDDFLQPTWIGQNADGDHRFQGRMGMPLLFNERLRADSESNPEVGNAISPVARGLCPIAKANHLAPRDTGTDREQIEDVSLRNGKD